MGLLEVIVVVSIIGGLTKDSDHIGPKQVVFPKKDGIVMSVIKEEQLQYVRNYRKENPNNAYLYPIEDDLRGSVRSPYFDYLVVRSCDDLQKLCNQPMWGTITDKHKGTFSGDMFDCKCSW